MRASLFLFAVVAAAVVAGCRPRDADMRLARAVAERRNLEATFDRLEERLIADQARVRFWREMRERHESISAIACASQEEHAEAMAMRRLPPDASSLHRARVAAALMRPGAPAPARVPAAH